jgi:hypothetical protein
MYQILKVNLKDGSTQVWKETPDPALAYELAVLLHQATIGQSGNPDLDAAHYGAFSSHIVKDGKNAWWECCKAAIPVNVFLN